MKLSRLKLNSDFNSLSSGFELEFRAPYKKESPENDWSQFHPYCFAGLNGSGKSNILEALSHIFYHLENCVNVNHPKNFHPNNGANKPNAYELEYYIVPKFQNEYITNKEYIIESLFKVVITKKENELPKLEAFSYPFENIADEDSFRMLPTETERKEGYSAPAKAYLPNLIIGYSSGENEILSIPFLKSQLLSFDEYQEFLIHNRFYKEPENSLVYIDYEMSQAVLLSNLIFHDEEALKEKNILKSLKEELGVLDIKRFRMNLNIKQVEGTSNRILDQLIKEKNTQDNEDKIIDKFKNCATCYYDKEDHLILDFWVDENTKIAFKDNFKTIYELFQAFQLLYTLNYISIPQYIKSDVYNSKGYYTDGKIPTPAPEDKVFYFLDYYIEKKIKGKDETVELLLKNLSDGEQQFLHTLGICLMLRNRNALLLLDEPETHFNPDWRSKFISVLKKSLDASGSNNLMRDVLITSHSPFIISDCYPDKVIVFERDKKTKDVIAINAKKKKFKTFGTDIDIIMENIFDKGDFIGEYSKERFDKIDYSSIRKTDDIDRIKWELRDMGDSLTKDIVFAKLNRIKRELTSAKNI
ncbi:ABC transporter [Tenacibaculum sp. Bg11-29]|uniref:restriction system-associated AAA family ATPase n=1 Tax=Tenacibaculum sp. Bg11-29 TaxID=2058306 RepID=UPI000C32FFD1|nr:restriction system-associated AAA family ATPase [Tenacibaculum sp. Bg11-29]PKH49530.1 ABC transporter [Tenacibaculum sp. Bg11-29]